MSDVVEKTAVTAVQEPGYANVWSIQTEGGTTVARLTVGPDAEAWAKRIESALNNHRHLTSKMADQKDNAPRRKTLDARVRQINA
jgi:hypothetical protein